MIDAAAHPRTDLKDTLEEMRASAAARGARKGLTGAIGAAMLAFFEVLLALLADLRAGKLVPPAPNADDAAGGATDPSSPGARLPSKGEGQEATLRFPARSAAMADDLVAKSLAQAERVDPGAEWTPAGGGVSKLLSRQIGSIRRVERLGPGLRRDDEILLKTPYLHDSGEGRNLVVQASRPRQCCFSDMITAPCAGMTGKGGRAGKPAVALILNSHLLHKPAAFAAVAAVARADSKNGVFGERDSADDIVPA